MPDIQYDSATGERLPANWQSPRTLPADMTGFDTAAAMENIKNHGVDQAMKAINAAIQFQGMRGYQQALKNGEPAEKAMAKFGPMIFRSAEESFAPSVKALTPPVPKPISQITPYQAALLDLRRKQAATTPSNLPVQFERDPNKEYITKGGALIPKVKPPTTAFETVKETIPAVESSPAVEASPAVKRSILGIDWLMPDKAAVEAKPAVIGHGAQTVTRRIPVAGSVESDLSRAKPVVAVAPSPSPTNAPAAEIRRLTKDGRTAIFDSATKQFLRYAD